MSKLIACIVCVLFVFISSNSLLSLEKAYALTCLILFILIMLEMTIKDAVKGALNELKQNKEN